MKSALKCLFVLAVASAAAFAALPGAGDERVEVTGWVSDESCGAEHTRPGGEDCVEKCLRGAPHLNPEWVAQRMVLVSDEEHRIWLVDNPEALKGHEGKHVRITGRPDAEGRSVLVLEASRIDE